MEHNNFRTNKEITYITYDLLASKNGNFPNISSISRDHIGIKTIPAKLKSHSTENS